jgi:hypothetical protein
MMNRATACSTVAALLLLISSASASQPYPYLPPGGPDVYMPMPQYLPPPNYGPPPRYYPPPRPDMPIIVPPQQREDYMPDFRCYANGGYIDRRGVCRR